MDEWDGIKLCQTMNALIESRKRDGLTTKLLVRVEMKGKPFESMILADKVGWSESGDLLIVGSPAWAHTWPCAELSDGGTLTIRKSKLGSVSVWPVVTDRDGHVWTMENGGMHCAR